MRAADHSPAPEELMAYLDGELPPKQAESVRAHLSACVACEAIASDLRSVSREMTWWQVEDPAARLTAPVTSVVPEPAAQSSRFSWLFPARAFQVAAIGVVVVAIGLVSIIARPSRKAVALRRETRAEDRVSAPGRVEMPEPPLASGAGRGASAEAESLTARPVRSAPPPNVQTGTAAPMIVHTARLSLVASDFDAIRPAIDRIVREVGGFIGKIEISGARGDTRSLHASLRVPAGRLETALAAFRVLGQVTQESQNGEEVTDQIVDLDARLASARTTEKRLVDLLQSRTGKVADVLAVEQEMSRVRGEIERLDAQRRNLGSRVTFATLALDVTEPRKAGIDLGALPVPAQFRNALVDGVTGAFESALGVALFAVRVGPSLLLWAAVLVWPARALWRRRRAAVS